MQRHSLYVLPSQTDKSALDPFGGTFLQAASVSTGIASSFFWKILFRCNGGVVRVEWVGLREYCLSSFPAPASFPKNVL